LLDATLMRSESRRESFGMPGDSTQVSESTTARHSADEHGLHARLVFSRSGKDRGSKDVLRPTTLIGSMDGCNVRISSPNVSPAHCVLTLDDRVLRIRDLRSKSGTQVNGKPVSVSQLFDGDLIRVGDFKFRLETNLETSVADRNATTETDGGGKVGRSRDTEAHAENGLTTRDIKTLLTRGLITADQQQWLTEGQLPSFQVENYRVLEMIGSGGMGWVYSAEEAGSGEQVALKVLSRHQPPGILARFRLEARAGMRLNHPHIVRTQRSGETDDVYFVVMELMRGVTLQELVERRGPLDWKHVCDLAAQAASALQHAHEHKLIHRDVKPANLIIDPDGTLKVLDFGLSLINDDEDEFSLTMISGQNCIGTPDFIAPEQTIDSFTVDARADVYSLGCTLYYALTAAVPFAGDSVREKLDAHRAGASLPLRQRRPELPAEIVDIVDRMMARDAGQRFDSAAAAEEAVQPFAKRYPIKFDFTSVLDSRCVLARQRVQEMVSKIGSQSSSTAEQVKRDPQLKQVVQMWPNLPANVQRAIMALVDAGEE